MQRKLDLRAAKKKTWFDHIHAPPPPSSDNQNQVLVDNEFALGVLTQGHET